MTALAPPTTNLSFTVPQPALTKALKLVDRAISDKTIPPEISCFLLDVEDGSLTITGTDLELAIRAGLPVPMAIDGRILLPARLLSEFVDSLNGGDVTLTQKPGTRTVRLVCGRNEANINGMDAEAYPTVYTEELEAPTRVLLPARLLRSCINDTVFSAATDDTRPVLSALLVKLVDGTLTMAAADGFRLAVRTEEVGTEDAETFSLLVPAKAMKHLAALLPDTDDPVEIAVATGKGPSNLVRFAWGNVAVISRLIDGQFPDYQRIIPVDSPTRMVVPVGELLEAVKVANVFSRDNSNIVRLDVVPGESDPGGSEPGQVTISATSAEQGDGATQMDAAIEGPAVQISLNGRFVRDVLTAMGTGEIAIELSEPTRPTLLRPVGRTNSFHVVMPMHTQGG